MRRRPAAVAVAIASVGAALALALTADGQPGTVPELPSGARPEVPGSARTLVPFGIETTTDGLRAWALGQAEGRTVVLPRAPNGGWSSTPLPVAGRPVGGSAPQHAGELAADGHGAILLADPEHPDQDAQLLVRVPGGAFTAAPAAGAAMQPGERLVANATRPDARALLAVIGGADAATLVAPTNADGVATGVLRLDADGWHRESIAGDGPVHPVGLAAAGPARAWLLGTAGDRVVLLHREPPAADAGGDARWVPMTPARDALLAGQALPAEVSAVAVDGPPADPLTATADGLWLDLRVTPANGSAPVDVTEHLAIADAPAAGDGPATTATPTPSAEPSPEPTTSPSATPGPVVAATLDGRWCDLDATICDHRLGFTFARGVIGYRSVAGPAGAGAPFGTREVSAPVDVGVAADARAREAERQGGYAQLAGDAFVLRDGIGEDGTSTTQALAFSADGTTGFTGGTVALGAATAARPATVADAPLTSFGDAIVSAAASPNGDGRVLAISRQGGAMLYTPDRGWKYPNTGLMSTVSHSRFVALRAVAWPRPNVLIGVGSAGALVTALRDPVPFDLTLDDLMDDPRRQTSAYTDLPVEATLLAVACTSADPLECIAVGRNGLIVRGDGKNWHVEHLPAEAPNATDVTSVAYDGRTPLIATTDGLYQGDGDGRWARDDVLRAQMEAAGRPAAVERVATEPGGGTVVDGRFERDAPTAPWRATSAPLDLHPVAIAAVRDGGTVRTIVSAAPSAVPLPTPVLPDDGDSGPSGDEDGPRHEPVPLDVSPVDAVVLRETADGWVDLDGASYQPSGGRDLPRTTPNTRVLILDSDGTGMALGGIGGTQTDPRGTDPVSATASARRFERGGAPPVPPSSETAETGTVPSDVVRLAVGGHPTCLDRCTGGGGQGVTPDVHLGAAVARVKTMVAAGDGPAALLFGGGRASRGGEPLDEAGARRYRELTQGAGVPTYVLPGPGDLVGAGDAAFAAAFADAAAPEGTGAAPDGVDLGAITQPESAASPGGRRVFAFDVRAAAGTVRVVAIDNAGGRLAGGSDGPQAQWLRDVMNGARDLGIPVIVVGSASLDGAQLMPRADDADEELALLAGRASAYVATAGIDDPQDAHFGGVLTRTDVSRAGSDAPLAVFQSSTLGYGAPRSLMQFDDDIEEAEFTRQTSAALLMLDVSVGQLDARTGVAPVTAMSEPLVDSVAFDTALQTIPVGFALPLGVAAADPAPMRFLWHDGEGAPLEPASAYNGVFLPLQQCVLWSATCDSAIPTDIAFSSSNSRVARFVAARRGSDPGGARLPEVVLDADGHVVDDPRGVFCPLAPGSTDVTVTTAGRRVTTPIQVVKASLLGLPRDVHTTPIAPGTCGFPDFLVSKPADKQAVAAPETLAPTQRPAPVSIVPQPAQPHSPVVGHQPPHPVEVVPPPLPAPAPGPALPAHSAPLVTVPPADHPHPPVAPTGKPPAPAAPPVPPSGLAVQSAPATQAQTFQATQVQEQRRHEQAFEADSAAVAYAYPPSPLPWELLGGGAALALAIAGGSLAGHARRRALAPALASATVGPAEVVRRATRSKSPG